MAQFSDISYLYGSLKKIPLQKRMTAPRIKGTTS